MKQKLFKDYKLFKDIGDIYKRQLFECVKINIKGIGNEVFWI